jgi:phage tail sheath protein FI
MPEYLSPGVYVEEIASGPRPIQGVGTSTTGFVGLTERGPTMPHLVTNWGEFTRLYGGIIGEEVSFLPFATKGFFDNDGQRLFVARITRSDAQEAFLNLATNNGAQNVQLRANGPGAWGNGLFVRVIDGSRSGFRITVLYYRIIPNPFVDPLDPNNVGNPNRIEPDVLEDYDDLDFDPQRGNFFLTRINAASTLVTLSWSDPSQPAARPNNLPFSQLTDQIGDDGSNPITAIEYIGDSSRPPDQRTGLAALALIDEIAIVCVPDEVHPALNATNQDQLRNELINQCETLKDRFGILQVPVGQGLVQSIVPPRDTSYAAIYYPWIRVFDPRTRDTLLVPPGGHVAGIYARSDRERGVHKAPANEVIRGMITRDINGTRRPLEFHIGKGGHDILNPRGINVIRDFRADGRGIRVWGARTLSSDPLWRYVNVRRLFLFVEESIDEGTQWVVFEPNDEKTWARVRQTVRNFLLIVWRDGALRGLTEEEAFFVRCDRTTMTEADIDAGRLICEVGIAPVKPAEFVIFRIQQKTLEQVS